MQAINLSQLLYKIDETLQSQFGYQTFWIKAEITDVKKYESKKWCFLKLIEKNNEQIQAEIKATAWSAGYAFIEQFERLTQQQFTNGLQIICKVKIKYSVKYGLNLDILEIDNSFALGQIALQKQLTLKKLIDESGGQIGIDENDNYFTPNKKTLLPKAIQRIALVTAHNSDGQRDFKNELLNNNYGYAFEVTEYLCQIQGDTAHLNIIEQINLILNSNYTYDCIALVRGGGSETDFKPFENYELARLIAFCKIPVFTGIGHDRNTSIVDLMARQLKTPTKVAAYLVELNYMFESNLLYLYNQIEQITLNKIAYSKQNLQNLKRLIQNLDPKNVLKKGYAIIKQNNKIISNTNQIEPNGTLQIVLDNNTITSNNYTIEENKK